MDSPQKSKATIWSFPYVVLMAVNLFQSMAAFMANTTLPVYADALGASVSVVGVVVSSFSISAILIRPFAGPAFDSFSRKRFLVIVEIVVCICMFMYGIVDTVEGLIAVRLIHGVGIGCGGPLAMSLVSEFLPKEKFASGISIYALAQSVAQVIGPACGLYLIDAVGFSISYFIASASVAIALLGVLLIKEPYRERLPYQLKLSRMFARPAISSGIALALLAMPFSCMGAYVVLYGYTYGIQDMGIFFVIYALCLLFTRPLFGNLADRFGTPPILILGIACFATSFFLLSIADSLSGFIVAAVVSSAGFGCCAPLLQSRGLASVPEAYRGSASNTVFTGLDIGMLIGPIAGGAIVDALTNSQLELSAAYSDMWLLMLVPAAGTLVTAIYWLRKSLSKSSEM